MSCCCGSKTIQEEDGTLTGNLVKVDPAMAGQPLIKIFEDRLRTGKIHDKKTAVHFGDSTVLTFAQLNAIASCLAKNLVERLGYSYKLNQDKDLVIAICLPMSEKTIAFVLAILKIGAAYLPLDAEHSEEILITLLNEFQPAMLITDDNGNIFNKYDLDEFSKVCKVMSIEELWLDIEFTQEPNSRRASMEIAWEIDFLEKKANTGENPVVIMHCHGLDSKNEVGIRLGNKSIFNLINFHWNKFKISDKDNCTLTVSFSSPLSIPQIFIPLLFGCTLFLFRRQELNEMDTFVKNVCWKKITRLSMPTQHLEPFLDTIEFHGQDKVLKSLKHLKYVVCRGSTLRLDSVKHFFAVFKSGVSLSNCCGLLQTTGEITFEIYDSTNDFENKLVSGRPTFGIIVDNIRIYIVDENMNTVPNGTTGEICVSGDCLALGYVGEGPKEGASERNQFIKNPFQDESPFDRLYRTGEYGFIVPEKRRIYPDERHDILAIEQDHDKPPQEQRKW